METLFSIIFIPQAFYFFLDAVARLVFFLVSLIGLFSLLRGHGGKPAEHVHEGMEDRIGNLEDDAESMAERILDIEDNMEGIDDDLATLEDRAENHITENHASNNEDEVSDVVTRMFAAEDRMDTHLEMIQLLIENMDKMILLLKTADNTDEAVKEVPEEEKPMLVTEPFPGSLKWSMPPSEK